MSKKPPKIQSMKSKIKVLVIDILGGWRANEKENYQKCVKRERLHTQYQGENNLGLFKSSSPFQQKIEHNIFKILLGDISKLEFYSWINNQKNVKWN